MFLGTTPSVISQFLQKEIKQAKPSNTYVPFAGNFVVEQLSAIVCPEADIHSTDVSLYSRMIGFGLSDQESEITFKEEILEDFPVFAENPSPKNLAIGALFFAEVGDCYLKNHIGYYRNMLKDAKANQQEYYSQIEKKINAFKDAISDSNFYFYGIDACKIIPNAEEGDFLFYDPPFWEDGYEKMFKGLEYCMNYEEPEYTIITEEVKRDQLAELRDREVQTVFRTLNPLKQIPEGYEEIYRYQYKPHLSYCLYSTKKDKSFVGRKQLIKESPVNYPIMGEDHVITEESSIHVQKVKGRVANHYRLMWTKNADMANSPYNYLVFVDEKLIGMIGIRDGTNFGTELCTIFADIATPTTNYVRLSKLILYICCTEEMLKIINDETMWEHTGFTTAVYSDHPVSMKYRKQFTLVKREDNDEGRTEFKLIYQNKDRILPTFKDGLTEWLNSKDGSLVYDESKVPDKLLEW